MRFKLPMHLTAIVVLLLGLGSLGADAGRSPDLTKPPARAEFIVLPLHIHILTATNHDDLNCKLTDADMDRIVGKMNRIWSMAGIVFRVESLLHEPAENLDLFDKQKDLASVGALGVYRTLCPEASRKLPGLHLYYVHELPPNGVYLGSNICFIKETANLRKVAGGIDEPLPRVSSHEIGHALGLSHRQDTFNLMASGTTGTILNEAEMARTRDVARKMRGALTTAECDAAADAADKAGNEKLSKRLRTALSQIPH